MYVTKHRNGNIRAIIYIRRQPLQTNQHQPTSHFQPTNINQPATANQQTTANQPLPTNQYQSTSHCQPPTNANQPTTTSNQPTTANQSASANQPATVGQPTSANQPTSAKLSSTANLSITMSNAFCKSLRSGQKVWPMGEKHFEAKWSDQEIPFWTHPGIISCQADCPVTLICITIYYKISRSVIAVLNCTEVAILNLSHPYFKTTLLYATCMQGTSL